MSQQRSTFSNVHQQVQLVGGHEQKSGGGSRGPEILDWRQRPQVVQEPRASLVHRGQEVLAVGTRRQAGGRHGSAFREGRVLPRGGCRDPEGAHHRRLEGEQGEDGHGDLSRFGAQSRLQLSGIFQLNVIRIFGKLFLRNIIINSL